MRKFRAAGVCCFGKWPVLPEESPQAYFKRIGSVTEGGRRGLILHLDSTCFPGTTPQDLHDLGACIFEEYPQ